MKVSETQSKSSGQRILIVDDNQDAAIPLAMLLRFEGYETSLASSGLEALTMAENIRPNIILLDIGLPDIDGYEVAEKIRSEPWGQDISLVALTGWGQDEDRKRTKNAGFHGHIVKPAGYDELKKILASLSN